MGSESRLSVPALQIHRVVAEALEGDRAQISRAVALVLAGDDLALRSLEPALYRVGVDVLGSGEGRIEELREVAIGSAAWRLVLEKARRGVGQVLGQIGCPWLPLKGMDTSDRFFERPEDRPTSDLDVLVPPEHFPGARKALAEAGWRPDAAGSSRVEAFIKDEGYNWQATSSTGVLLELHYRFWGIVGSGFAEAVWEGASLDPDLGPTAYRMSPACAFGVCALHAWLEPCPRPLLYWWELQRIIKDGSKGLIGEVVLLVKREGLQLPVGLAAAHVAELWGNAGCRQIVDEVRPDLGRAERIVASKAMSSGVDSVPLPLLYSARLLSGRPCRMGWKSVVRRVWPHPGAVELETDPSRPWILRRWDAVFASAKRDRRGRPPIPDL